MYTVKVACLVALDDALELFLGLLDGGDVKELAEVSVAEELAELVLVDGEGVGAALGEWSVAVVDVVGYVTEEQRSGEGRRRARVGDMDADGAVLDGAERLHERRHVEDVAEALAIGLEEHGEAGVTRGNAE